MADENIPVNHVKKHLILIISLFVLMAAVSFGIGFATSRIIKKFVQQEELKSLPPKAQDSDMKSLKNEQEVSSNSWTKYSPKHFDLSLSIPSNWERYSKYEEKSLAEGRPNTQFFAGKDLYGFSLDVGSLIPPSLIITQYRKDNYKEEAIESNNLIGEPKIERQHIAQMYVTHKTYRYQAPEMAIDVVHRIEFPRGEDLYYLYYGYSLAGYCVYYENIRDKDDQNACDEEIKRKEKEYEDTLEKILQSLSFSPIKQVNPQANNSNINPANMAWKTYTAESGGFSFDYPGNWKLEESTGYSPGPKFKAYKFIDEKGVQRATLRCPEPETGWEAWEFTMEKKSFIGNNNKTYEAWFRYGTALPGSGNDDLILIFIMNRESENSPWEDSCLIESQNNKDVKEYKEIFKKIYNSI